MNIAAYLPRRSALDPVESSEGSLDPLGLAQLAGRLADRLVPGMTERTRRPRFLTGLALGSLVLQRDGGEVYRDTRQGPAQIAWERLLAEAYARRGAVGDRGLLGIPGIQKARDARDHGVRLVSRLYLKSPGAVGLWVAYKGLAEATHVLDDEGNLLENGYALLEAWERGIGKRGLVTGPSTEVGRWLSSFDEALEPLTGGAGPGWNPQQTWTFLHENLHPSRITDPERAVLYRLLEDEDAARGAMFAYVKGSWSQIDDLRAIPERRILEGIPRTRADLRRRAEVVLLYEALAGHLTTAFESVLNAAVRRQDGRVDAASLLRDKVVGPTFAAAPARIREAAARARPAVEDAVEPWLSRATLEWIDGDLTASPEALFGG